MQVVMLKMQPFEIEQRARDMACRGLGVEDITAKLEISWERAWRIVRDADEAMRKEQGL